MTQFFLLLLRWNYLCQKDLFLLFTLAQVPVIYFTSFGYPLVIGKIDTTAAYHLSFWFSSDRNYFYWLYYFITCYSKMRKSEGHVDM